MRKQIIWLQNTSGLYLLDFTYYIQIKMGTFYEDNMEICFSAVQPFLSALLTIWIGVTSTSFVNTYLFVFTGINLSSWPSIWRWDFYQPQSWHQWYFIYSQIQFICLFWIMTTWPFFHPAACACVCHFLFLLSVKSSISQSVCQCQWTFEGCLVTSCMLGGGSIVLLFFCLNCWCKTSTLEINELIFAALLWFECI